MQLASRNPLLRTSCCWLGNWFARLTGPLPSKGTFTATRCFAELLRTVRNKTISAVPSHQRKSKHQGPWSLALAKPRFWKLGCWIGSLLLETSEDDTNVNPKPKSAIHGLMSRPYPCKELHCTMHLYVVYLWWCIISTCRTTFGKIISDANAEQNFHGDWCWNPGGQTSNHSLVRKVPRSKCKTPEIWIPRACHALLSEGISLALTRW